MKGIFVTGTDTGVGKTFFSCCLITFLKDSGIDVLGFKPVETGCSPVCEDAKKLSKASGVYLEPVYSLKKPLAPSVASELEGLNIDVERLVDRCRELLSRSPVVIEGAGGIMVPITWNFTFLNLAASLSLPVVVVALNKLGVINHTLLTVNACLNAGLEVKGVVLNSFQKFDESFGTNLYSLRKLLKVPVVPFFSCKDVKSVVKELELLEIFLQ